jgi:S-adenosylmethionine synthetase
MMFGYATNETENYMPLPLMLAHMLLQELADMRRENSEINYLRPDAKSQVTIQYSDDHKPLRIDTIVISTQHDDFVKPSSNNESDVLKADNEMLAKISSDIIHLLIPRIKSKLDASLQFLFDENITYHINPTGKFVIGGPHGDTGLTGRKIIVDTYGGMARHGGGAFSGKDPSKVDRSAAYAMRWVAKNVVAAGLARRCEVQVAYAIGKAQPVGVFVETFGTETVPVAKIQDAVLAVFDLRPAAIIRDLDLLRPIYSLTSAYGHFGRELPEFAWERTDRVSALQNAIK